MAKSPAKAGKYQKCKHFQGRSEKLLASRRPPPLWQETGVAGRQPDPHYA